MRLLSLFLATLLCFSVSPAFAGEVIRETATSDFEWSSTECQKPVRPYIQKTDPQAQPKMQDYALKVAYYLDCLKLEAQRDFDRAQQEMFEAIQRNLQTETDQMNDAVERMARQTLR